jgi:hypothetical protein
MTGWEENRPLEVEGQRRHAHGLPAVSLIQGAFSFCQIKPFQPVKNPHNKAASSSQPINQPKLFGTIFFLSGTRQHNKKQARFPV